MLVVALTSMTLAIAVPASAGNAATPPAAAAASAAAIPALLALKTPSPTPEKFGEQEDFPWLPPLPGSAPIGAARTAEGLDVTTADDAEPRIVGADRMSRRYQAPAGLGADAIVRAYATALRSAGWVVNSQSARAPGGALVVAHYAATGRDVWARVGATEGAYELAATDAGQGITGAFESACSLVANGIAFDLDKATLLPESEPTLAELQRLLKAQRDLRIEVVAYTDSRDADGDAQANRALSARRAEAVKSWFRQHRIDGDRITTRGLGDAAPLRPSDTEENRARNRRIEIRKVDCR
jgi:outer membrane protein OmpA-like peptidoglycan-associated protein